jgi:hypothetical protein
MIRTGLLVLAMGTAACATTSPLQLSSGPRIPAAEGTVNTEMTKNNNTRLDVNLKYLAPPEKVASGATTYVVWAEPRAGGEPSNLGAVTVDENREGKISTKTPLQDFRLFLTAERSGQVQSPSGEPLLWADVRAG